MTSRNIATAGDDTRRESMGLPEVLCEGLPSALRTTPGAHMRRREFITLISTVATWPLTASAQHAMQPVFGILLVFSQEAGQTFTEPLRAYMRALGYVEGRNIRF
jgi:hypothetical protein